MAHLSAQFPVPVHPVCLVQGLQSLLGQPQLLTAQGQLVQVHHRGVVHRGEIGIGILVFPALQVSRSLIIGDAAQNALIPQGLGQSPCHPVLLLHLLQMELVAVAVAHIQLGKQHQTHIPLLTGPLVGLAQTLYGGGVAVPPDIAVHPCPQPGIGAGVQVQRLLVALLLHPPQGQLAAVQILLQSGVLHGLFRVNKAPQHCHIQPIGAACQPGPLGIKLRGQITRVLWVAGQHRLIAALHPLLPHFHGLLVLVPGHLQPLQQQAYHIRAALRLALLDFGEVGHSANPTAQPLLAPVPAQALAPDDCPRK